MDIFFTEEESEFREEVREFVQKEIAPKAEEIERTGKYPKNLLRKLARKGYFGALHPVEYGGTGKGAVYEIIISEEIAAVSAALNSSRAASCAMSGMAIAQHGTEEQKRKYEVPIARGEKICAIGITEPNVGSDVAEMETRAVRDGDEYIINGEKRFTTNGSVADVIVLFAITDPTVRAHKGMTAFIVDMDLPGIEIVKDYELHGERGLRNSHIRFHDVRVPKENVLGKENDGFKVMMGELDIERTVCASESVGHARAAFEYAVKFSKERKQFNQPIKNFEAISFRVADMATKIECARLLTLQAARMYDMKIPATKEAAIAKLFAAETALSVASDACQILGGIGYTKDTPVERYLRDARMFMYAGGTIEMMRYIIQREVYRENGY
ncbi:MAG: acyl-CoA dehydrogenase family protein [Candidatus Syntropharchaeia archaeon]